MSKLLVTIATCADDAAITERALDWIYHLNGKQAKGHLLLAWAADVHAEFRAKILISGELAFESVSQVSLTRQGDTQNKIAQINTAFRQVAAHVQGHCRFPWLWLEPDCVPLKANWIEALANAYDSQPLRYCGSQMKTPDGKLFMARVGIYHPAASSELDRFCNDPNVGFEFVAGEHVVARCTKSKLIQQFSITDDSSLGKIRPDAVLLHGDKWGKVIKDLRGRLLMSPEEWKDAMREIKNTTSNGNGRLTVEALEKHLTELTAEPIVPLPKIDLRTKAGRALKAAKKSTPLQTT